jgi:hypothetical protein
MRGIAILACLLLAACAGSDYRRVSTCGPSELAANEPCPEHRDAPLLGYRFNQLEN